MSTFQKKRALRPMFGPCCVGHMKLHARRIASDSVRRPPSQIIIFIKTRGYPEAVRLTAVCCQSPRKVARAALAEEQDQCQELLNAVAMKRKRSLVRRVLSQCKQHFVSIYLHGSTPLCSLVPDLYSSQLENIARNKIPQRAAGQPVCAVLTPDHGAKPGRWF